MSDPTYFHVGDVKNSIAAGGGKPLDGIKILALEQMQALPFATQLLGRLGAEVVKIESPVGGDLGRGSLPAMEDPSGQRIGATFLRNNLSKKSIAIDLKTDEGRELVLKLAPHFDVVAENFRPGALSRLGLDYEAIRAVADKVIYVSLSGFGNPITDEMESSPYGHWPALASVVEAMSGLYELKREPGRPPVVSPAGALGDISTGLFCVIGILAALRQRERTGEGQRVDVAMYDALVAMADIVVNFHSLGMEGPIRGAGILDGFLARDGYFVLQVIREPQWPGLCALIGRDAWGTDPGFATRAQWSERMESDVRPAIESWAQDKTRLECCEELVAIGCAAGPCFTSAEVVSDAHLASRHMLVAMDRTDDVDAPVLIPGNPVKLAGVAEGPERRVPLLGEHTGSILRDILGLDDDTIAALAASGVIGGGVS